jgi:hypothetical protein
MGSSRQLDRWLDLVDWATANDNEGAGDSTNRIFRKIFHIVVSAHLSPENPFIFQQVLQVHGTLKGIPEAKRWSLGQCPRALNALDIEPLS